MSSYIISPQCELNLEAERREITGFPGYEVDSNGTVWTRWAANVGKIRTPRIRDKRKPLKPLKNWQGKCRVCLYRDGQPHYISVHRLVLEAFVGPCPEGLEACHNNGKGDDNGVNNLRWDTKRSNELDKIKHGTKLFGERMHSSKLKEAEIITIRQRHRDGFPVGDIAKMFNVSKTTIDRIAKRIIWKHLN